MATSRSSPRRSRRKPRLDRLGREEVRLDELAEILGDAMMVARHDLGVRERQAERPAEQRDDGIPVGQSADRGRGREGRDVPPGPMHRLEVPGDHEERGRRHQQHCRRELDPSQGPRALGIARLQLRPAEHAGGRRVDRRPRVPAGLEQRQPRAGRVLDDRHPADVRDVHGRHHDVAAEARHAFGGRVQVLDRHVEHPVGRDTREGPLQLVEPAEVLAAELHLGVGPHGAHVLVGKRPAEQVTVERLRSGGIGGPELAPAERAHRAGVGHRGLLGSGWGAHRSRPARRWRRVGRTRQKESGFPPRNRDSPQTTHAPVHRNTP